MEGEKYRYVGFWHLLMSAGFAASFVTVASYLLIPNAPLAIMIGGVVGIPTGIGASSARTLFRSMARVAGFWAALLGILGAIVAIQKRDAWAFGDSLPVLAFVSAVVSVAALSAGCSQMFCRAVVPNDDQAPRFQYSLAEALGLSVLFAICLGSAIWWKQQAPEVIQILATPGMGTLSSGS